MALSLKRILIMAGGTGGHVFPGLAVAELLRAEGVDVAWLGTSRGLEAKVVPKANIPLHLIAITGLRGKGVRDLLLSPFKIISATIEAYRIIKQVNPDVVLGMGGFASGPGGLAAWLSRRPLVIHEQNAKAGLTNRLLSKLATTILEGFPNAFAPSKKVMTVGNPVRSEIESLPRPDERASMQDDSLRLLVLGGSLGAMALNRIIPNMLAKLPKNIAITVTHQAGDKNTDETKKIYESMGLKVNIHPFIEDMASVYRDANFVICRAGALTVSEICVVGIGAIFIPYPYAADDHQTINALYLVNNQAAIMIQERDLTDDSLGLAVATHFASKNARLAMANAAYQLRKTRVAEKIAHILDDTLKP